MAIFVLWSVYASVVPRQSDLVEKKSSELGVLRDGGGEMNFSVEAPNAGMAEDMMAVSDQELANERGMIGSQAFAPEAPLVEKKVIKNGNLTLKVEKTEDSVQRISEIVKNQKGEVFSTNFYEQIKGQKSGSITVKVPVEKFEETMAQIKTVATQVVFESTTGQDVTERYADLEAQLKNKKAEEESFVKIFDQAVKIEDVLAVTEQISRVRGEIERLEGQIRFMDSQTDMSTIVVNLSEDVEIAPVQNDWRPWQVAKKAFSDLVGNAQDFVDGVIRFVIVGIPSLIPFFVFLAIVYLLGRKAWMKIKK